ncbi:TPA: hypothetical protein VAR75_000759 [Streptococcus agalactiae]|nr:hypothetical protein [Streptococcus agalactiae]HEN4681970.1 hypothetical protein [Streptococcus agalactiae]HEN4686067.1 hypothetical protein [Streptococcus agalactiae]HEO2925082.1 hypothetical protein [Streptococcus agalactiae]HEO7689262.1 hypothetical protein [Streptococcus agalactiae]
MKEPKTFEEAYKQLTKQLYEFFIEPLEPIVIPVLKWTSLLVDRFNK